MKHADIYDVVAGVTGKVEASIAEHPGDALIELHALRMYIKAIRYILDNAPEVDDERV